MKVILLIMIGLSILNASFIKSGDVVSDSNTGLEWQDDATPSTMTWQGAIDYCEAFTLDGGGWRLPNLKELTSLVDDTRYSPAIDTTVFTNTISSKYWSSTTSAGNGNYAWTVSFHNGSQSSYGIKTYNSYVRCVRAGQ